MTVLTPFLRHLNTGTLAFFLFVALASLTNIRGKEAETKASIPGAATKSEVVIANFSFSPKTFTIAAGATVTWTNHDGEPHRIAAGDGSFHSPGLDTNATYTSTFPTAGTFDYICSIHPFMHGTVVVTK